MKPSEVTQKARQKIKDRSKNEKPFFTRTSTNGDSVIILFEPTLSDTFSDRELEGWTKESEPHKRTYYRLPLRVTDQDGIHRDYILYPSFDRDADTVNPVTFWEYNISKTKYANKLYPWQEDHVNNPKIRKLLGNFGHDKEPTNPEATFEAHKLEGLLEEIPELKEFDLHHEITERVSILRKESREGGAVAAMEMRRKAYNAKNNPPSGILENPEKKKWLH